MASEAPFTFSIQQHRDAFFFEIDYRGYLAATDVEMVHRTRKLLEESPAAVGLSYDASAVTGFHRSQITAHADLFLPLRTKITGIALHGAGPAVRFAAVTVGLLARLQLKVFGTRAEAVAWLLTLHGNV